MSFRRRLSRLECIRPWHRSIAETDTARDREIQRKLNLPLPEVATQSERDECLRLMVAAQSRTRINRDDTGGWDDVRDYALSLHKKYGTDPYWGETQGDN